MEQMIALNVGVLTRLTYAAAPAFVARGKGTIVNIASRCYQSRNLERRTEGKSLRPGSLTIAASRTRQQGIACAGRVAGCNVDRILGHSRHAGHNLPPEIVMPVEEMVDAALAGLDLGEFARPRFIRPAPNIGAEGSRQF